MCIIYIYILYTQFSALDDPFDDYVSTLWRWETVVCLATRVRARDFCIPRHLRTNKQGWWNDGTGQGYIFEFNRIRCLSSPVFIQVFLCRGVSAGGRVIYAHNGRENSVRKHSKNWLDSTPRYTKMLLFHSWWI